MEPLPVVHIYAWACGSARGGNQTLCGKQDGLRAAEYSQVNCVGCRSHQLWLRKMQELHPKRIAGDAQMVSVKIEEEKKVSNIKQIFVESVKKGAAAGAVESVSEEITAIIAEHYPQILLLPDELRNLAVCFLVNSVASACPNLPGAENAQLVTGLALEGIMTSAVASITKDLVKKIGPKLAKIAIIAGASALPKKLKGKSSPEVTEESPF